MVCKKTDEAENLYVSTLVGAVATGHYEIDIPKCLRSNVVNFSGLLRSRS